ncbi:MULTISPECIES: hypothetical protein [Sphingomonas]|jgi:hypothetical protein|uniref:DUF7847 domain-containing protein n=1 Tax=Sphingomonas leidyi TaxID=68569 RepID=A0A7X5ZUM1_9SPHN|nr:MULTISPECIES: hypothetical protein [Sphingomonas]MBN8811303.1 hypothetical protein [Sphingomonas sp.]NIJ64185.1 hypothetical protein [Sphingomonas leidyi]OJY53230.1 MAG: hypothetical protein BGP17_11040 [Sphingomonas sp. 67-41]
MAEADLGGARYEIGAVISRAFETIGSNFLLFCGLALVLAGTPQLVLGYWQAINFNLHGGAADAAIFYSGSYWGMAGLTWLVSIVTGAILQAALTRATVMHLSGETPQFGALLAVGISMILPMIAIGLIAGIGVGIGMLLLIVPGVILWLVWAVVTPAYVQEKVGILEAFSRSAALTSGARWRIFLTMLIVVVLLWVLSIPVSFLTAAMIATGNALLTAFVGAAVGALGSMVMVAVQASIYVELRQLKEGIAPSDLEAIFA